jgi:hypothetical protein
MVSELSDKEKRTNKAKMLKNSTVLRKYKSSKYPQLPSLIDFLYDEMIEHYGLNPTRPSIIDNLKYHIEFFIVNLFATFLKDPTRVISYPQNRNVYSDKKSKFKKHFKLSYRYSAEKGSTGKGVIPFLEKQNYIETFPFQHDRKNPDNSYQSRMRATTKLIDLIESQYEVSEEMLELDTSTDELIVMKGVRLKGKRVTIYRNGKKLRIKKRGKRKICKTPNTRPFREMRKNLELINKVMEEAEITLDITDDELMELNERLKSDRNRYKQAIDFSRKRLHRVFLDRLPDRGGRFYGAWYQNVPKEYRNRILINEIPTVELDYSALHPNLLYAIKKVSPSGEDLYELDGYSDDIRKFLKGFFLRIINAKSREGAKGSIREAAFLKGEVKVPDDLGNLEDKKLDPLIDKFAEKHKPIAGYFFSGYGNYLQWVDSQIAEFVLAHFTKMGQPCLPMHDSFIVDCRLTEELLKAMNGVSIEDKKLEILIKGNLEQLIPRVLEKRIEELLGKDIEDIKNRDEIKDRLEPLLSGIEKTNLWLEKELAEAEARAEAEEQAK